MANSEIDILINEVKVYGGLESDNSDTRIKIVNKSDYDLNGKETFKDIIQSNPELNFAGGTTNPRYIQIRGLGELSQFSGEGAPHFYVGLYLDDINFTGIGGITLLDDINQIEIFDPEKSDVFSLGLSLLKFCLLLSEDEILGLNKNNE